VLHQSSPYVHAIVITPAELLSARIARFPRSHSLPHFAAGSASASFAFEACSTFIRITACTFAESPKVILYTEGFSRRSLCDCSDCYRLERQLPGGVRTHWKTVPLHGALQISIDGVVLLRGTG
jgi:hypothetical protein